ncbi:FRG domain-containing protein [Cupriavidus necator]
MEQIDIESMQELLERLNDLPNHFLFRGHANANWGLESSLERIIGSRWSSETAKTFEDYSLSQFKSKFHLYDTENAHPKSKLAWLSIMQHYGVPTRLLDFTESPYIALYFALETYNPHSEDDLAVLAIDYTAVMEKSVLEICNQDSGFKETRQSIYEKQDDVFDNVVDRFSYNIAWIAEPKELNVRLDRQSGSFLLSGNKGARIKDILEAPLYADVAMYKYRIPAKLHQGIFALLRKMNLTSKNLYGNLDGLARSIRMQMQVYST